MEIDADAEFFEARSLPAAVSASAAPYAGRSDDDAVASVYYDAAMPPADMVWEEVGGVPAHSWELTAKIDELLLEELEEAMEMATQDSYSEGASSYSRRSRLAHTIDAGQIDAMMHEMTSARRQLDYAISEMLRSRSL
jgi:hypothetical protein